MFKRHDAQVVMLAQCAILVWYQLGDHEQADPFGAGHAVGQAGQHKVADIFREIIVRPANVNFLSRKSHRIRRRLVLPWTAAHRRQTLLVVQSGSLCPTIRRISAWADTRP